MKHYGDITKINGTLVEPVNVVIGGSPCQDLSVAGKQAGLAGERSGLFMEQLRIIKEMRRADLERGRTGKDTRPRYMVWENVPGAFSSNKGADFSIVLQETAKVACEQAPAVPIPKNGWPPAGCLTDVGGQWSIAWRVFDAQFWGVPQRRKRIALIADFGGLTAPEILFERQGVPGYIKPCGKEGQAAPGNIETRFNTAGSTGGAYCIQGNCIDRADTAGCNGKGWTEGVSYTLNTIDRPAVLPFVPSPPQGDVVVFEPGSCSRVGGHTWQDGKAPALRAQSGDNQPAIALENHPADSRVKIAEDGIVQTLNARMGTGGGMFPSLCALPKSHREPLCTGQPRDRQPICAGGQAVHYGGTKAMIMFENYQFANWRPGCGTLKASGGDYGGGSENLIVYQYWNGEQVTDTLTARNAGGGQRMPDKQNFNCVVGFHLLQDPITDENKTPCLSAGSSTGEASLGVCEEQSQAQYIVRRLTPLECERLQGFPDGWTDIGEWTDSKGKVHKESTDSARYKALGNSIAIPPWTYVLQRLSLCCGAKPTMASLFDGIGGFPYIWESLNGKGSCVWASEIEDFPIAVTKYHFPEEVNNDG